MPRTKKARKTMPNMAVAQKSMMDKKEIIENGALSVEFPQLKQEDGSYIQMCFIIGILQVKFTFEDGKEEMSFLQCQAPIKQSPSIKDYDGYPLIKDCIIEQYINETASVIDHFVGAISTFRKEKKLVKTLSNGAIEYKQLKKVEIIKFDKDLFTGKKQYEPKN